MNDSNLLYPSGVENRMASQLHTYTVTTRWSGGREGRGSIHNGNSEKGYDITVPPEFGGPGGALNPEELLTDAISGCYAITFGIVAANRRLPIREVVMESIGTVEQAGANFKYTSIALSPRIIVAADATDQDIATAVDMAHKADAYCIVTNAVRDRVNVSISPSVEREGQAPQGDKPVSGDQTMSETYVAHAVGEVSSPAPTSNNPADGYPPKGDTAPPAETSYTGSEKEEEVYGEAGDAPKPNTATPDVPANGNADAVSASETATGDPDAMKIGAVPG